MVTVKPTIKIESIRICRSCIGTGYLKYPHHVTKCETCNGHGRVLVKKEINTTIETL